MSEQSGGEKDAKVCVITGGSNGIGRCMVDQFIKTGYRVFVVDRDESAFEHMQEVYGKQHCFCYGGDIAASEVLEGFADFIREHTAHVDALIHNACLSRRGILSGCGYEDFNYVLQVGVSAPYYLTMLLQNLLSKEASIVNIASTRAEMSQADTESYSAAKGGIRALTHALSASLAGKARVNCISPGWIHTGDEADLSATDHSQHPAARVGRPSDIAKMALYLCSDAAGFITGENITIDGGMTRQMVYHNDHGWTLRPE